MERAQNVSHISHENVQLDAPTVPLRKDLTTLRRLHSGNQEHSTGRKVPPPKQYESEYDKLNRYLQNSSNISRSRSHRNPSNIQKQYSAESNSYSRPRSRTGLDVQAQAEQLYMATEEIASMPNSRKVQACRTKTSPYPFSGTIEADQPPRIHPTAEDSFQLESAIYGVAQGKGPNLVMELKEMQKTVREYFDMVYNTSSSDPQIADLRTHLRLGENCPLNEILLAVHGMLRPHVEEELDTTNDKREEEYVIDFHYDCKDKSKLKERILLLFAKPGPPSVTYQKVTAKLDSLLDLFVEVVVAMRTGKNETLVSPYHAFTIIRSLSAASEGEYLSSVLQSNERWIRWGTETGLPPLSHLYFMKHPPTYEMRKAVVLSLLAERKDKISSMLSSISTTEALIPPVYGRMGDGSDLWQVTEFNPHTNMMETHRTKLPQWIDECYKLSAHLRSGNRSPFKYEDHMHALYSVYLVVIKDITLADGTYSKEFKAPSVHQLFVGSSTTGVLYKLQGIENNHCKNIEKLLIDVQSMSNFRCHPDITLVDACLALSWIRDQPRAIFVINSFQEGDMVNLSLNKKKPFHDKMIALEHHYINSKKLGPTCDMRYGMNQVGDATALPPS